MLQVQVIALIFQSTLSARRATTYSSRKLVFNINFNPRSPRGERPADEALTREMVYNFNPRSPRGERQKTADESLKIKTFQSTLSARRAT